MEKILITEISDGAQWNLIDHELMDTAFGRKSVLYDKAIYLIGGELDMDHLGNSLHFALNYRCGRDAVLVGCQREFYLDDLHFDLNWSNIIHEEIVEVGEDPERG